MARSREGSIYQRHDHKSCPDPVTDADGKKVWPAHRCRGHWVASVDLGIVAGKRKRRTLYADTEREAKSKRRKLLRELDEGRLGDDATLSQWLDHWVAEIAPESMSERTLRNHRGHVEHWIKPQLGRIRLSGIGADDVRRFKRYLETAPAKRGGGTLSTTTARYILTTLSSALSAAEFERRITWNPAKAVSKPEISGEHHGVWTDSEQARRMVDAGVSLLEQARAAVALYNGLRQGEALGLTWADIDLDAGLIDINKTASPVKGRGMVASAGAKTAWSVRVVPMHPLVRSLLTLLKKEREHLGPWVFGGTEIRKQSTDYREWKAQTVRADLPYISPHGARGTAATLLRAAGVPTSTIGEILGHKPGSTVTELAYAHAQPAELSAALKRLT